MMATNSIYKIKNLNENVFILCSFFLVRALPRVGPEMACCVGVVCCIGVVCCVGWCWCIALVRFVVLYWGVFMLKFHACMCPDDFYSVLHFNCEWLRVDARISAVWMNQ